MDKARKLGEASQYQLGLGIGFAMAAAFTAISYSSKFNRTAWLFVGFGVLNIIIGGVLGTMAQNRK
jgi:hypothetical protein